MDIHRAVVADVIIAPDLFKQQVAREYRALVADERHQQVKLFVAQFDLATAYIDAPGGQVQRQITRLELVSAHGCGRGAT